jgi:hypothetical protein
MSFALRSEELIGGLVLVFFFSELQSSFSSLGFKGSEPLLLLITSIILPDPPLSLSLFGIWGKKLFRWISAFFYPINSPVVV